MEMKLQNPPGDSSEKALALLKVIKALVEEMRPDLPALHTLDLDASLDKDLGLDSLTRMELLSRLEEHFGVTLSTPAFVEAETPRDLLRAVVDADGETAATSGTISAAPDLGAAGALPHNAQTFQEVLEWHVAAHPDRPHIRFYEENSDGHTITYGELKTRAESVAIGLQSLGVGAGEAVAIMLPTGEDYFFSFFGILLAGAVPVPIYPPVRRTQLEEHLNRHRTILDNCAAAVLITVPEAVGFARLLKTSTAALKHLVTVADLAAATRRFQAPSVGGGDVAFIQYTSGSTGDPKGVVLTHANLLTNLRRMGERINVTSEDVFVSWLPLYHDMGLIGAWLGSLHFAYPLVIMSPLQFLARPRRWLQAIHRYRGTLSAAPNFAYELCLKRLTDEDLGGLDLGSWRCAFNGAEPVSPETLERFSRRLEPFGFRREALMPVYGLAETSLGLTFPPLERGWRVDYVSRETFMRTGEAVPAADTDDHPLKFLSCGQPMVGHEIRVVDPSGRELPERREGRIQFRGPSSCKGYLRNPDATRALFQGDWLETGDKGYIAEGEIHITGRTKDIVIRAGRNIYPSELEEALGNITDIRKGNVAVFGSPDPQSGTERLVVLAETRETAPEALERLRAEVNARAVDLVGTPPDEIVLSAPGTVLKTSSGKIRRAANRERYEQGKIGEGPSSVAWQVARLAMAGILPMLRRVSRMASAGLYNSYAWLLIGLAVAPVWAAAYLVPRAEWRWSFLRRAARYLMKALNLPVTIAGRENIPPDRPFLFVSNHASYIDSSVLTAVLPGSPCFVAKAELAANPVAGSFLRRIGTVFVERFDRQKGVADLDHIRQAAASGRPLVFFAEGTISRMPGLLPFRMGAFLTAAAAGIPVVPVAIRGTRSILRADTWFFRRGAVMITIGKPLLPDNGGNAVSADVWPAAVELHNRTREHMLRYCREPDLSEEKSPLLSLKP